MKKILLLFVMVLGVIPTMWADISVQTIIFDGNSQPPIVGGIIEGYSNGDIIKKGIIVSILQSNLIYNQEYETPPFYYVQNDATHSSVPQDYNVIDCSNTNNEQFFCPLLLLKSDMDYYVKAYAVLKNGAIVYGNTESIHSKSFNRYNGSFDVANVWHAFDYTLFDLVTDEIINPNDGFYYSTNENPTIVRHQVGTSYNTCYKFATEWNYKLWLYNHTVHSDITKMVSLPVMSFSNGRLSIERNPLDVDKDITIYYSINGNYFRPETYTDVYTAPIEITEPCAVYCYAISSEGYISYTNMYVVDNIDNSNLISDYKSLNDYIEHSEITYKNNDEDCYINPIISNIEKVYVDLTKGSSNSILCYLGIGNGEDIEKICFSSKYLQSTSTDNIYLYENNIRKACSIKELADNNTYSWLYYNPENSNEVIIDVKEYYGKLGYIIKWQRNFETSCVVNIITDEPQIDETFGKVADVVDLGLSVKWASWNVGADKPEGLGNLYAWGELSPKTDYSTSTYKFYDNGYTKYGSIDNKYQLDSEDDVAQQTWGDKWRIPTIEELKELKEKCTFTKTELNGVPVTKVTGPNGNFIYFPYPGNFTGTTLYFENSIGSYWSSDLESNSYAKDLDFRSGMPSLNGDSRYHGQSIRPVYVEHTSDTYGKVPDIIDLGLSSGTLWASWNLGASSPEEYGAYFAWGETSPKNNYDWSTYKFGEPSNFTKYNTNDGLTELELEDDAANVILGKDWRMPTHKEELELVNECSWESVELNGISGYKVTGPNGNSIFLPRGGLYDGTDYDCDGTTISNVNTCGWYWSSTLNSVGSAYAQGLCFFPSLLTNVIDHERCDGHNIRPVYIRSLTPTDDNGGVDYGNDDIDDNSNLNGNIIGNMYYNISDESGEYSSTEGCIILRKPTSDTDMNNLEGQDIFGEDFKNGFTGIVFMVQGSGTIKVNAESIGSMTLKVKIGNSAPITMELEGKMKASFPYSVTEPTYVYIYCGETSTTNARGLRAASSENALKIYGIEWSETTTNIESILDNVNTNAIIYNLQGQRMKAVTKGINIINGKKVIVK